MRKLLLFSFLLIATALMNAQNPIITKWYPINNDGNYSITIPVIGEFNYTWEMDSSPYQGNGVGTTGKNVIDIPTYGTCTVKIYPTGNFKFYFATEDLTIDEKKAFYEISQWGNVSWNPDLSYMFSGCENLTVSALDIPNFSNVTNMQGMFFGCRYLSTIITMNSWNTSQVTDMSWMFTHSLINQNIANWDTSRVTNMSGMFYDARNFNKNIGNWNTSNVTNMTSMFAGAHNFDQNIGNWDTSKVTSMSGMFSGTVMMFNQNIGNWNTSKVTDMSGMFQGTSRFNQNISNWDTSKVTNMSRMFKNASVFNQNIDSWDTSKVTNMSFMFSDAIKFNKNISNWDTSNVTDMTSMFQFLGTNNVFNQNISNWDTSKVTSMQNMFQRATKFNQNIGSWKLSSNVDLLGMFNNSGLSCENYKETLKGWGQNSNTPNNRFLGAEDVKYGDNGKIYRDMLEAKGWIIIDDSYSAGCDGVLSATDTNNGNNAFKIYPNPVKDILNFSEEVSNIRITDLSGRTVKEVFASGKSVNIYNLVKGNYIVKAVAKSGEVVTNKIVKE
ncbi:BspA family leucine-rich repeat surface protein [Epilithonimonas vandammei]|uniref:BspA family leucine-rich repeat surface protein n=1 Tax=Epilithonimonas vandammei TaxID=2487072 RepID=UPI002896B9FB|nr:BspA family leucine-rich repeat surface protein [Epilithonimonas vandammei]